MLAPRQALTLALALAGVVFALDQASKYWVLHVFDLPAKGSVAVMDHVSLTMVWNYGISYGLFRQEEAWGAYLFAGLSIAISVGLLVWLAGQPRRALAIVIGVIVGGALGNMLDRLIYGAVADFVHLHAGDFNWYVFNVADTAIVLGGMAIAWDTLFAAPPPSRKAP